MLERYFSFWISFTTNITFILILLYRFYTLYNFFCSLNAIIPCVLAAAEVGDFFSFRFFRYCFSVFIYFLDWGDFCKYLITFLSFNAALPVTLEMQITFRVLSYFYFLFVMFSLGR